MQRIEKIKAILKSNNIAFSEVETGIFKLEGEVLYNDFENHVRDLEFTIVYLLRSNSQIIKYIGIDNVYPSSVFSSIWSEEKLCLEKRFPCKHTDTIDSLWEEGEYGFVNNKG